MAAMSGPSQAQLPFDRLGEYTVLAPISEGGMASVWLGCATAHPEQFAALKVIRAEHGRNKEFVAMFMDEARIASRLSHPNIVHIHHLGHDGKRHFLAMEVLRGRSLLDVWARAHESRRRLPYEVVAWIGARVADALHHAHELLDEAGRPLLVVHRDVNPSNILLTDVGTPKLIDFGLAKARDRIASTAIGVIKGKLAYLAPEQVLGHEVDRRADVFALGVTLWEVSLHRRLFRGDSDVETVRRVRDAEVPDPRTQVDDYPPALADALGRALVKDPTKRWQTAAELRDALDAFVRQSGEGTDERTMSAITAELFAGTPRASWERLMDESAGPSERIRVWDDGGQKMTWMNASIEAMTPEIDGSSSLPAPEAPKTTYEQLDAALAKRLRATNADPVTIARAWLERAWVDDILADGRRATEYAEESLAACATAAAHAMVRRLRHARGVARSLLVHLEAELADAASQDARGHLLAERARLIDAAGADAKASRAAWQSVLDVSPGHPAGLRGLEAALAADPTDAAALAEHLALMSDACAGEPRLAAWLQVERARWLDRELAQPDAAKAALLRALELDRRIGPVRASCVTHAVVHRDAAWLVALLADEAALEAHAARAASLELDAACILRQRLGDTDGAVALLERASGRVPVPRQVHRRILDDLTLLYERAGRTSDALRVRRVRLTHLAEPRAQAHEQRSIAALEESLGDRASAIASLERALDLCPEDTTLVHDLDRLLEADARISSRIELWTRFAAVATHGADRARRLLLAANLAASDNQAPRAVELARGALVADPENGDAIDRLLEWLASPPGETAAAEASARIAVHAHGVEHAPDDARRVMHLEAIALLQDEMLGDAPAAAATYEAILRIDEGRRTALVGLARSASRAGDGIRLARALLDEAARTEDSKTADSLRVRAAEACARADAERALAVVRDVLARTPGHRGARRMERRLHETAGRWTQVDASLASCIENSADERERSDLWLARAELQRTRLRAPKDALESLRAVLAIDAQHPGAGEGVSAQLEAIGDPRTLRDGLVELASMALLAEDRARGFARAAEIDELVLSDDEHAAELYVRARSESPGDAWLEEREVRLLRRLARTGARGPLEAALSVRLAHAPASADCAFDLACALLDDGGDAARATSLLETALATEPEAVHALRSLERAARMQGSAPLLASALARQVEALGAEAPKLGALWAEAALIEWKLPNGDATAAVEGIVRAAPSDLAALAATVRLAMPRARAGDASASARLVMALRGQLAHAEGETDKLCAHLAMALVLEREDSMPERERKGAALSHYREALVLDARSVVAAAGAARLGSELRDPEAMITAALAQAELAEDPRSRAVFLVQAAGQTLSGQDLGMRSECLARAGEMLERALDADPEGLPAVALLVAVRGEESVGRDRLLVALRRAFDRARSSHVVENLGIEVARVASLEPPDRVLAVEALRRVLAVSPGHGMALRALAGQYVAVGAWAEAVETLQRIVATAREPSARMAALFELGHLYGAKLSRPLDVERSLRAALDIDPTSVEALRKLLQNRRAEGGSPGEVAGLLARLGEAETAPEAKSAALTELAELLRVAGDAVGAEKAIVEAAAQSPNDARLARLAALFPDAPAAQARALSSVVARAAELDRPDAACVAELGRLEVDALGRWADGVAHLRVAIGLSPTKHEARAALAKGLAHLGEGDEAIGVLLPMMMPDAAPLLSLGDPAAAVATLERALAGEGRHEEAIVARELRAIAGGLDDGAHVELRARRLPIDSSAPTPALFDAATLRASVVPVEVPALLLDVAAAIGGVAGKFARVDVDALGVTPRDRLTGHPVLVYRLARMLGLTPPDVVVSATVSSARVVANETPWLVVPESLLAQAETVQSARLVGPLLRLALGVPWLEDLRGIYAHAVLCAAARQVVEGYASEVGDAGTQELVGEFTRRIGRAIGRKQRRALQELAPALGATRPLAVADVEAFERALARAELRTAFLLTGDLLATLDAARLADPELMRLTAGVGKAALAATLGHPLTSDLVSFALAPATTALRRRAGTTWGRSRYHAVE